MESGGAPKLPPAGSVRFWGIFDMNLCPNIGLKQNPIFIHFISWHVVCATNSTNADFCSAGETMFPHGNGNGVPAAKKFPEIGLLPRSRLHSTVVLHRRKHSF